MRPEDPPHLLVAAFADEVQVELAERREEPVGVIGRDDLTAVGHVEAVVGDVLRGEHALPDAAVLMRQRVTIVADDDLDGLGHRTQHADRDTVLALVRTEHAVGIVMGAIDNAIEVIDVDLHRRRT